MYYKITKGSETFNKIQDLIQQMERVNNLAREVVKEITGKEKNSFISGGELAGGIGGIHFYEKPDGWRDSGSKHYDEYYYPKKNKDNTDIIKKIQELPILKKDVLAEIIGFEEQFVEMHWYGLPSTSFDDENVIIEVNNSCEYSPNNDIIEITGSEYKAIYSQMKIKKGN